MSPITTEYRRITKAAERMMSQSSYVAEAPLRLHGRGNHGDSAGPSIRLHPRSEVRHVHDGLGGPDFGREFEKYLTAAGVCMCERFTEEGALLHVCDRDQRIARFRASRRQSHPTQLKRAFRQLRRISPAAFDIIFPVIARGQPLDQVRARVNSGRESRGQEPYSPTDFEVHWFAGLDLMTALY